MTNTPKHTPGPWVMDDDYGAEIIGGGKIVAVTMNQMLASKAQQKKGVLGFDAIEQIKANARLIAASPILLSSAEKLLEAIGHVTGIEKERKEMIDAIRKAYGDQNA